MSRHDMEWYCSWTNARARVMMRKILRNSQPCVWQYDELPVHVITYRSNPRLRGSTVGNAKYYWSLVIPSLARWLLGVDTQAGWSLWLRLMELTVLLPRLINACTRRQRRDKTRSACCNWLLCPIACPAGGLLDYHTQLKTRTSVFVWSMDSMLRMWPYLQAIAHTIRWLPVVRRGICK